MAVVPSLRLSVQFLLLVKIFEMVLKRMFKKKSRMTNWCEKCVWYVMAETVNTMGQHILLLSAERNYWYCCMYLLPMTAG
jgi:hypothetical protein